MKVIIISLHSSWIQITVCPKVRVKFEVPGFSLICRPIPKPFGMVNHHKLRFGLVYNKPCNVLLTSREYGIKFEKILKEEKRWKFWHKGFFEMFMDSETPCMLKKLSFIILRCTPILPDMGEREWRKIGFSGGEREEEQSVMLWKWLLSCFC